MAKRGIDISAHQGNIDLNALKNQIDFVIIRVGYGTKGTIDTKFTRNADLCRSLGIPVGFYWYSYALDQNGARDEANAMIKAIAPYKDIVQYGVWFDMEDADGYKKRNGMPSNQMLRDICHEFCATTENAGYYSGIYASQSWFNNQLNGRELDRFDKWVAQWPTSGGKQTGLSTPDTKRSDVHLWQFTSAGRFSGYSGNLDTNYAYTTFPNPGASTPAPEPTPAPAPAPAPSGSTLDLATGVMEGKYGDGDARKQALGSRYDEVQDFINHIFSASVDTLANEVINENKYGAGGQRKAVLGSRYREVQDKVNQILGGSSSQTIKKGDRVRFTGTRSYSGMKLASWTHNDVFDVIEVSGDRVVIGKGNAVTSAVNIKDCQKV